MMTGEKLMKEIAYMRECFERELSDGAGCEDSGLSPDEVQELAKAKADGRLVVLPCKVGDTVYAPRKSDLLECTVQWITVYNGITIAVSYECDYKCDGCPFNHPYSNYEAGDGGCEGEGGYGTIQLSAIGKTVFLTREAAEKALEVGE